MFIDVITHQTGVFIMNKNKEQYTVQLDPDLVAKIDEMAEKIGVKRSQLMRNFIKSGYEDAVMLDKIGMIAAFKFGQKLIRKIREESQAVKSRSTKKES